jgi:GrpB-like predicted nucleotidyltransferase (UPF0157 family)
MNTAPTNTMQPIEICAWCPEWPTQFAVKAKLIRSVLDARAMRIDHIGSTAIRGLAAKPIIDIQISVADLQSVEVLRERMTAIGYVWRPSNADLTKRYFREAPGNERTHVHVRGRGSWSEQWSLLFRDYMRAHAQEHAPYAELKRALAARYQNDRVALHRGQVRTLWTIIHRADRWAAQTGWQPGPSDA